MGLELPNILSQGWLYRGEGNANIVLWLPKTHQILRIRKVRKPTSILEWFFDWLIHIFKWNYTKEIEHETRNLNFYNLIMIPLLGEVYASPAGGILTCKREIQRLDKELTPFRPEHRKNKCLQFGTASLFRDYAFLSNQCNSYDLEGATYAIEIKPKQGWLSLTERKFNKCQFCLNQYLKIKNLKIKELSSYCPLDLFSGNRNRMNKALNALIRNPQNNFRIFRDGLYYYGENVPLQKFYDLLQELFHEMDSIISLVDDFNDLIIQALLKNFDENNGCVKCDDLSQKITYDEHVDKGFFVESKLPPGCVLEKILSIQKLSNLSFKEYYNIFEALNRNSFNCNEWSYIDNFLQYMNQKQLTPQQILNKCNRNSTDLSHINLAPYLIAAVANDCSFMITFRKTRLEDNINKYLVKSNKGNFLVNVGIFDLYPKSCSTFEKHIKRNKILLDVCKSN